jgi:hypothetical protein
MALLDDVGLPLDRVRVLLVKPAADTLADTTIAVQSGDSIPLTLLVPVASGVTLVGTLQFKSGETVLFEGKADVVTVPLSRSNDAAVSLPME